MNDSDFNYNICVGFFDYSLEKIVHTDGIKIVGFVSPSFIWYNMKSLKSIG